MDWRNSSSCWYFRPSPNNLTFTLIISHLFANMFLTVIFAKLIAKVQYEAFVFAKMCRHFRKNVSFLNFYADSCQLTSQLFSHIFASSQRTPSPQKIVFKNLFHISLFWIQALQEECVKLGEGAGARILKRLWSPGIDSKEWILPAYVARRAGTINLNIPSRFLAP